MIPRTAKACQAIVHPHKNGKRCANQARERVHGLNLCGQHVKVVEGLDQGDAYLRLGLGLACSVCGCGIVPGQEEGCPCCGAGQMCEGCSDAHECDSSE